MPQRGPVVFLAVALIAITPFLVLVALPFLTSFILASILAVMVNPVKELLSRRFHFRPVPATLLTTFATVLVAGILVAFASLTITRELAAAYDALDRQSLEEGGWPALVTHTADRVVDALATRLPVNKEAIRTELIDRMRGASGYLLNNIGPAIGGAATVLINALMVTVFLYFLLRYGKGWVDRLTLLTPLDPRTAASILGTIHDSVVANVSGVFAAAVGQGLFLGLGFWFVGLRSPALWGAVGGLASIIPVVGTPLVWVPVAIAFFLMGSYWKAVLLVLWGALVVGSVDNVLRPFVAGAGDKQHPVLIALAAIGGTYAFGPMGILLGPLVVSLAAALLEEIQTLTAPAAAGQTRDEGAAPPATGHGAALLSARGWRRFLRNFAASPTHNTLLATTIERAQSQAPSPTVPKASCRKGT
jgi:predicted PurR-regulated permease PerM